MPDRAAPPSRRAALLAALSPTEKTATSEIARILDMIQARNVPRNPDWWTPQSPGIFQPDVPITGDPHMAAQITRVLDLSPSVKASVKSITSGPTRQEMIDLENSGFAPWEYGKTDLLGQTRLLPGNAADVISLNPGRTPEQQTGTAMHELTHVAGAMDETVPAAIKLLWHKFLSGLTPQQISEGK